ncbi:hypothetical protein ACFXPV_03680 [Streptomyces sp. NPDC059118]
MIDREPGPDLALYLGDRDVPDLGEDPRNASTECVTTVEAGADRYVALM